MAKALKITLLMLKIKILTLYYRHKFYFFYSITKRYISLTLYKAKSNFGDFKILLYFGLIYILSLEAFISIFFYIKVQSNGFESLLRTRMNYFQLFYATFYFLLWKSFLHYLCVKCKCIICAHKNLSINIRTSSDIDCLHINWRFH